ncbi:type VI secretion system Vgr family protein [Undibacterium sp. RuRC25W]|uniref:type VI secretion system Vgr family protein n=1 Tax=Undibacterium sp. RuRC25W TaxID=3413047 RepID=UPI003BF211BD
MNGLFTHPRALSVSGPALSDISKPLTPLRLVGTDGINQLFDYRLTLQTSDRAGTGVGVGADLDLDSVIGKEVTCTIELEGMGSFIPGLPGGSAGHIGAGTLEISALVTAARFIGVDSRHAIYEFTLRPWLHLATLTSDCKVFQNQTPVETMLTVLNDYAFVVDKRLIDTYPLRDYCVQYNETDFAFVSRLMQEWGINYHFEHSNGVHRLILSDFNGAFRTASDAYATIPYYPLGHKIDRDYIHAFSPENSLTSGSVASRDYDYTRCRSSLEANSSDPRKTGQNNQELYSWHDAQSGNRYSQPNAGANPQANKTDEQGRFLTRLRIEERRQHGQRTNASAYLRGVVSGVSFTLTDYPQGVANREYVVIRTHFFIENVSEDTQRTPSAKLNLAALPSLVNALSPSQIEHGLWQVQTDFTVQPSNEIVRPEHTQIKPRCYGPEVATVTGPHRDTAASNIYTDQYGRIKVQFPWDRYGEVNHNSSCWVRVALPWAGNQLGQQAIPRIGQEVLVDFIGGDPDRPICSGSVHNQFNMPPWQLPSQQALMGIRSRELTDQGGGNSATGRSNHLILDDTHDQIQAQLKSDHDHSQLSLGFITRIESKQGRQEPRGQGFELRTDGRGAIRTKDGLLITTEARDKAQDHITSLEETAQRLQQAHSQHSTLAEAAQQAGAQEQSDQSDVAKEIKQQNSDIAGDTITHVNTNTNADNGQFPELAKPHIVIASPAGIATTTPGNTQHHSGQHHAITAEEHISLSSGKSLLASARKAIRLFAYKAGMKLIAANGDIDMKALQKNINVLAKLTINCNAETIQISAEKQVVINGGGSYTRWNAQGIENGTNGAWCAHAATHSFQDGKNMGIDIQGLPHVDEYDEKFAFHLPCGTPIVGQSYHAKSSIGEHASKTTSDGATPSIYTSSPQPLQVAAVWHAFNSPVPMTKPGSSNTSNNKGDNNAG